MCDARHRLRRPLIWYSLANTGAYALIPPAIVGLLLPAVLLLARSTVSARLVTIFLDFSLRLVIPSLAAWWPPFVLKERIEGDGREILYFLRPRGEAVIALGLAVSYLLLLVPFVFAARGAPGFSAELLPLLAARCLFMTSLAFGAASIFESSALALILALLFNMLAMAPLEAVFGIDSLPNTVSGSGTYAAIAGYAALSVVVLSLGEFRSRQFTG